VQGKYRLESVIGEGGMGTVWRAVHTTLHSPVAVKFVEVSGPGAQEAAERFLREAQLAASVRHRMVVDVLDFGQMSDGQPFMIMELLEGENLAERLGREPRLTTEEVITVFTRLLRGLSAVHDAGIVHRDLKPENVQLVEDEEGYFPKLTDFGISRVPRSSASDAPEAPHGAPRAPRRRSAVTTQEGHVIGTPEYMSPEQARGIKDLDQRTDIYSIGVMLYEVTTGQMPFSGEGMGDLLINIITEEAVPPALLGVATPISEVIERAMDKDREQRQQSAEELCRELLDAADEVSQLHEVVPIRKPSSFPTADPDALAETIAALSTSSTEHHGSRKPLFVASVIALLFVGSSAAVLFIPGDASDEDGPSRTERRMRRPEPAPSPIPAREREPELGVISIDLEGVPEEALVTVDGSAVDSVPFALISDGELHVIEVSAEGFEPWSMEHVADADGRFVVDMQPL